MSRLAPLAMDSLPTVQRDAVRRAENLMGFVANDALTMARNPALMEAFAGLVGVIYGPGKVDAGLKRLIGLVTSTASGCEYCTGHTAFASLRHGVDEQKLDAVWAFKDSEHYSAAEKAALRVALHGGQTPNAVTDAMFDELAQYYDEDACLEIVAVISMFGFLNRWNSTLRTDLEALPGAMLEKVRHADTTRE